MALFIITVRLAREEAVPEMPYQSRFHDQRVEKSEYSPPEVGIVVDVIPFPPAHVGGVDQVQDPEDNTRDGDGKIEIDLLQGAEKYIGEYNGGDGTGGPDCPVVGIIFMLAYRGDRREDDAQHKEQDEVEITRSHVIPFLHQLEYPLYFSSE